MGPFGKYMVFGTQLYEIWKPTFNMESYIFFMHFEPAAYFIPRLPPGLVIFQNYSFCFFFPLVPTICLSLTLQWNWMTLCRRHHQPPLTPLSGRQSPFLSLSLSSFFLFHSFSTSPRERKREGKWREEEVVDWRELWATTGDETDKVPSGFVADER